MIVPETFTLEWINSFRMKPEYKKLNPPVLEKMIYALGLLEKLAESGLDFIFKGGTSLSLLLDDFQRFSTDIDIITNQTKEELEKALSGIIKNSVFTSFKPDEERSKAGNIPKAHYYVFYNSTINPIASVTLDVLFEQNSYPVISNNRIANKWIRTTEPFLTVKTPDIDSILGDKLTAFAPGTTGVPYYRNETSMSVEIIKQLFDIGTLFNKSENISNACQSFKTNAEKQIRYLKLTISLDDIYDDILQTSLMIAKRDLNIEEPDKTNFHELQKGISSFGQFLSSESFRIEQAIVAAGKACTLMAHFKTQNLSKTQIFVPGKSYPDRTINNVNYSFLNRFKKTNPEAFFYWYNALELLNLNN